MGRKGREELCCLCHRLVLKLWRRALFQAWFASLALKDSTDNARSPHSAPEDTQPRYRPPALRNFTGHRSPAHAPIPQEPDREGERIIIPTKPTAIHHSERVKKDRERESGRKEREKNIAVANKTVYTADKFNKWTCLHTSYVSIKVVNATDLYLFISKGISEKQFAEIMNTNSKSFIFIWPPCLAVDALLLTTLWKIYACKIT